MILWKRHLQRAGLPAALIAAASISLALAACTRAEATPTVAEAGVRETVVAAVAELLPAALDARIPAVEETVVARMAAAPQPAPATAVVQAPAATPTATAAPTPAPTPVSTPMPTAVPTATVAPTAAVALTPATTPTPAVVDVPTPTPAAVDAPTPTATPMPTPTPTPEPTETPTPPPTPTPVSDIGAAARSSVVRIETSYGSATGVIIETSSVDRSAVVLTAAHVTALSSPISVFHRGATRFTGTLLGEDAGRDLALLRICCSTAFAALPMGDDNSTKIGERVEFIWFAGSGASTTSLQTATVLGTRFDATHDRLEVMVDTAPDQDISGSAVVDSRGRLAGLGIYAAGTGESRLGFAVAPGTIAASLPYMRNGPFALQATPIPPQAGAGAPVFGPRDGDLLHNPAGLVPVVVHADVNVADTIASATFVNPYPLTTGTWSYGLKVRVRGLAAHSVFVRSDRRWYHWIDDAAGSPTRSLASGDSSSLLVADGAQNNLRVVTAGTRGWLFINGEYAATLDLGDLMNAGAVRVVTGLFSGDQQTGQKTSYRSFTVYRIGSSAGETTGTLVRGASGFIPAAGSSVSYADVLGEAVFANPSGAWTYGLLVRNSAVNTFHAMFVGSDGYWHHHVRNGSVVSDRELQRGRLAAISTAVSGRNHLLVLAHGTAGALFVNGQFAGDLDLSELQSAGDVKVFAGYFNSDQDVGTTTSYEAFIVRPAN